MPEASSHHSVSDWLTTINRSQSDAETAWRQLWNRYAPGMMSLARRRLAEGRKPLVDEEDVVIEAFKELFRGVQRGTFARLANRDDLQQILITLTQRRAIDAARRNAYRAAHEAGESALPLPVTSEGSERPMERVPSKGAPPEFSMFAYDEFVRLLDSLEDDTLRQVAAMQVFSATTEEIAAALGLCVRSVQRKIRVIAQRWHEVTPGEPLSLEELRQTFDCWRQMHEPP
jgi:DNA-directed RNA polymerase specialized sigma24 family protein